MKPIVTVLAIWALVLGSAAYAATKYWDDGGRDHYWTTSDNWYSDGEPNSTDSVVIDTSQSASDWPDLDANRPIASLEMDDNADLDMGGFTLTITNGVTIQSGGASMGSASGGTVSADSWSFSGTITFTQGTYVCR